MSNPMILDGQYVIVTREWFDRVQNKLERVGHSGCPFCSSTRAPQVRQIFDQVQLGCLDCDQWWT